MDLFLGIGDIPIYNFDKMLQTNNLSYLVVDWDERKEIEVPEQAQERWNEIYNEYCKRTANNESLTFYNLAYEISYLEMRYTSIYSLVTNLCEAYKKEIGLRLNKWGVPFNINGKIKPQLKQIESNLKFAAHIIQRKKTKLEGLKGEGKEEGSSIIKQKIKLERVTGLKIDLKKTSVEEWIELFNEAKSIAQQNKKAARNG